MEPWFAVIRTRSKQQALDWSVVLLSQGIESIIERAAEGGGWQLVVGANDSQRALQTLRQYKVENRAPVWRRSLSLAGVVFDWRAAAWFVLLAAIFAFGATRYSYLTAAGMMDREAVWSGQWWRLFTAVTLHRDLPHLASNMTVGVLLLGLAMGSFGSGIGLLAAYLAGVCGNVAGLLLLTGRHLSLGASGMIFGALGLLTGQMIGFTRGSLKPRQLPIRVLLSGVLLLVLFGVSPGSDVLAHLGGFVAGVVFGAALSLATPRIADNSLTNRLGELLCAALVIFTWWLALR